MKKIKIISLLKIFPIFLLLISTSTVLSQSLSKLDSNNGFRGIKFGMSPKQFSTLEEVKTSIILKDVTGYSYRPAKKEYLQGVPIEEIRLSFFKNKLYYISLSLGGIYDKYTDSQFKMVQDALISAFGNKYVDITSDIQDAVNYVVWDGNNVRCDHVRLNLYEDDGSRSPDYNYISGYVSFVYKPSQEEQKQSEF